MRVSYLKALILRKKTLAAGCALLLVSNCVTLAVMAHTRTRNNASRDYPFIDIARNYIPQDDFIVNIQPLRDQLRTLAQEKGADSISIYYEFLNTGANIQINNETRYYPASLVKLPSAMVAMKKVEKGDWNLSSRLVLFEQDKDNRYGQLYQQPVGTSFSIEELLKALLTQSDNTAHRIIMRNLSEAELGELKDAIGLDDLFDEKSEIAAKEYSRMFRALYNSSFLDRGGSQRILEWLAQTPFKSMLASGLPADTPFAHKIGEDNVEKNYLDSGIVYLPNRPYLISVMIKGKEKTEAEKIMQQVAKAAYEYISGYE